MTYTFTAVNTGPVTAYFAGSGAAYESVIGMSINGAGVGNGASTGYGLNNHSSALGAGYLLGNVTAGDTLTFVLQLLSPAYRNGQLISSDPSQNVAYDGFGGPVTAFNHHVYSTPYTDGSLGAGIPNGTYVGFEDLPANPAIAVDFLPDYNYFDHTFVFDNVAVPEPSTYLAGALLALVFGVQGFRTLRSRKQTA